MLMAAITTTKLLLLLCLFALLALAMEMMPLQAQSAGTSCGVLITLVYMVCENYFLLPFYCKMAIFKNGQKIRHMMQFGFIIQLVCCLGWLCGLAFGQAELSDALTASVTFPALGITCIVNLAVFYVCILRGPPKLDIGAKDALTTVTGPKLKRINELVGLQEYEGQGWTTCPNNLDECHVVMLSDQMPPNSSMQQFMDYMSNVHNLNSVFLQFLPFAINTLTHTCGGMEVCHCILFDITENITEMLARRMPGMLKRLSSSVYLLPCKSCLFNGCHDCNQGLLHLDNDTLRGGEPQVQFPAAVCSLLDYSGRWVPSDGCICIPVHSASDDDWTRQLITLLELKGNKVRGRISVSSALEKYINGNRECFSYEEYDIVSLIIVPMLTEVLINVALTFWIKMDGFSSALLARRAMKDYLPEHSGGGFSPIAFLTGAAVKSSKNGNNSNVCQVLGFRGSRLSLRPLNFTMGFVNLICSLTWIVLVALGGGANKWYHIDSKPLSERRVIVIIIAISFSCGMWLSHWLLFESKWSSLSRLCFLSSSGHWRRYVRLVRLFMMFMIMWEITCMVSWGAVLRALGVKGFGRWLYAALQCLVWIKWGIANYLTNQFPREEMLNFGDFIDGRYLYASPFFLNAILAGVRAKWEFS